LAAKRAILAAACTVHGRRIEQLAGPAQRTLTKTAGRSAEQAAMRSVMKESDLMDIQNLVHRWEEGESVLSDPPLCLDLLAEIRRLRGLLMDVFPMVVGTSLQEPLRLELGLPPVQRRSHSPPDDIARSLERREVSH
jgi:hypothetical protein